jgi:tRNA A37 threonylcarbamoyladenosine dehydratase
VYHVSKGYAWVSRSVYKKLQPSLYSNADAGEGIDVYQASLLENEQRDLRFQSVAYLYENAQQLTKDQVLQRLYQSTVAVVGLGGVGSWAAESLARSGVGHLVLIDLDDICISNTNRQIHATSNSIGRLKIEEMKNRIRSINPLCKVTLIHDFVSQENVHVILDSLLPALTMVLDAIDGTKGKAALIAACVDRQIPIVTSGGAAGRVDPTQIVCDDLTNAFGDKLMVQCRKELRKHYGFAPGLSFGQMQKLKRRVKKWNIDSVYSLEEEKLLSTGDDASALRRCDGALGTACFVTGTYGFVAASRVVAKIAQNDLSPPRRG